MIVTRKVAVSILIIFFLLATVALIPARQNADDDTFLTYQADLKKLEIKMYWKDGKDHRIKNFQNLQNLLKGRSQKLLFATNGGMFAPNAAPVGLYIQDQQIITPLDTTSGNGNFYLKPNGVFYITADNHAVICRTIDFNPHIKVKYATQSGPMLLVGGQVHPAFNPTSTNNNIRNGVGVLPSGQILFVMSKKTINFYALANYFKNRGCREALYLDGFVSRAYLPEKNWIQTDGNFGVMIGVIRK